MLSLALLLNNHEDKIKASGNLKVYLHEKNYVKSSAQTKESKASSFTIMVSTKWTRTSKGKI